MKNLISKFIGVTIILILFIIVGTYETHYNRQGTITEKDNNVITIEDTTGNLWEYETNSSDFSIGKKVELKMYNNGTDTNIYDDKIEKIKIKGWQIVFTMIYLYHKKGVD